MVVDMKQIRSVLFVIISSMIFLYGVTLNTSDQETGENNGFANWIGAYEFDEFAQPNMLIVYHVNILESEGNILQIYQLMDFKLWLECVQR